MILFGKLCMSTELSGGFLVNTEFNFPKLKNLCDFFLNDQTNRIRIYERCHVHTLSLSLLQLKSGFSFDCTFFTCSNGIL